MIKTILKHKIAEIAINHFFDNIILNFNTHIITVTVENLTDAHIGMTVLYMDHTLLDSYQHNPVVCRLTMTMNSSVYNVNSKYGIRFMIGIHIINNDVILTLVKSNSN